MGFLDFYARTAVVGKAIAEGIDAYKNADKHAEMAAEAQTNAIGIAAHYLPEQELAEFSKPQLTRLTKAIGLLNIYAAIMVFLGKKRRFMALLLLLVSALSEITRLLSSKANSWEVIFSNMLTEAVLLKQIFTRK